MMAVSCGTPTPATMRVVQIEPGPMPTLTASAPASISALVPSAVATLPAITCTRLDCFLMRVTASSTRLEWPCAVSTTTRSTPASISALGAVQAVLADAGRRRDPQAALLVLAGVGILLGLLDVLDRDQADAADRRRRPPAASRCGADAAAACASSRLTPSLHRDQLPWSSARSPASWVLVAKRTSRLVRMPTSLPCLPGSTTGMPEIWCSSISAQRVGRASRRDGW